ncbi:Helix-turn-helix [Halomonas shengliensis]|uniref:Helix-turn-helix n=1 Tax=Halomonas shengliensis TaxID=419597 RepID=A0A1H0IBZ1_9GAMM|nr:helix-turn-helix transcriptional regulator [Halomonas shengliensis]SDO28974.1 Helix-turn-helix [Halomonas shengliensis]
MSYFTARDMVSDLIEAGMTQQQIAEKVHVSQATIARVFKGSDTRYESGKRLAALHRSRCPERYPSISKPTPPTEPAAATGEA